jgi:hypothetical protein
MVVRQWPSPERAQACFHVCLRPFRAWLVIADGVTGRCPVLMLARALPFRRLHGRAIVWAMAVLFLHFIILNSYLLILNSPRPVILHSPACHRKKTF